MANENRDFLIINNVRMPIPAPGMTIDSAIGVDAGRESGKGGIYVPYEVQNVHHNSITNCLNGGRGIFVHSNYASHHTEDVRVCNNHITRCDSNSIRVQESTLQGYV